ncbi:MAG: hypothetical protein OEZ39_00395 [Gammaproteobacteria bacterium]|nr:hypothetical protein [Gammaproteobacteria bacterium]MDH5650307.1 hypothetical protein [Gammaproteobacteria bacterium]
MIKRLLLSVLILVSGCAVKLNNPAPDANQTPLILSAIPLNADNLPDYSKTLAQRPTESGSIYHLAWRQQQRITTSYEIAIRKDRQADVFRPVKVIFVWTGKGFVAGIETLVNSHGITELAMVVALPVLGAMGGFVVGLFAAVPESVKELQHLLISSREVLVSQSDYQYDEHGRLIIIEKHLPGKYGRKLVRTEFQYLADKTVPYQVVVYSYPEKFERIITVPQI